MRGKEKPGVSGIEDKWSKLASVGTIMDGRFMYNDVKIQWKGECKS